MTRVRRGSERGVSLVALMVAITIMLVASAIMLPSWEYVIKNEREEELIFRGYQIVDAIGRCQAPQKGGARTIEELVKKRCLRKAYKDPLSKDGKWRVLGPGPAGVPPGGGVPPSPITTGTTYMGPMAGVGTSAKGKSLRRINGKEKYEEWEFRPSLVPVGAPGAQVPQKEYRFIGGRAIKVPAQQVPPGGSMPRP